VREFTNVALANRWLQCSDGNLKDAFAATARLGLSTFELQAVHANAELSRMIAHERPEHERQQKLAQERNQNREKQERADLFARAQVKRAELKAERAKPDERAVEALANIPLVDMPSGRRIKDVL
jgi:hypothetical protein